MAMNNPFLILASFSSYVPCHHVNGLQLLKKTFVYQETNFSYSLLAAPCCADLSVLGYPHSHSMSYKSSLSPCEWALPLHLLLSAHSIWQRTPILQPFFSLKAHPSLGLNPMYGPARLQDPKKKKKDLPKDFILLPQDLAGQGLG